MSYGPLDATFEGKWSDDGETFGGGWRPNPGADESINVAYNISAHRVKQRAEGVGAPAPAT